MSSGDGRVRVLDFGLARGEASGSARPDAMATAPEEARRLGGGRRRRHARRWHSAVHGPGAGDRRGAHPGVWIDAYRQACTAHQRAELPAELYQ